MLEPVPPSSAPVLTVTELNRMARRALESQLPLMWVEGEVSNFVRAASGHWYFTLKDATAQVRCTFFRGRNQFADFTPANGDHVEVRGLPSLYEARGDFQLGVETLRRAGAGRLFEAFLRLKAKLESEGLFDPARKRPLPMFPKTLGVVTSPAAAALRDVLTALARRMPGIRVVLYPAPVQGADAAQKIAAAIRTAGERREVDALIVCRGGGSIEDLWAFNEEPVARAIAACPLPVVSGVGHETDFTLADFAADVRAPTPTAAAELASPVRAELLAGLDRLGRQLQRQFDHGQATRAQSLDDLGRRLVHPAQALQRNAAALEQYRSRLRFAITERLQRHRSVLHDLGARLVPPGLRLARERAAVDALAQRHATALERRLTGEAHRLERLSGALALLDPDRVLARGYSRVETADGRLVCDAAELAPGDALTLRFHRGSAQARVESSESDPL